MGRIDESEIIYPLFYICCIAFCIIPLIGSVDVMMISSYDSFVGLLDKWYINLFYFARVILSNLDYMNFSFLKLFASLFTSLRFANIVMVFLVGYLWSAKHETYMKSRKRKWQSIIGLYMIGYILIAFYIILNFSITSVNDVMILCKVSAFILALVHFLMIVFSIIYLIIEMKANHLIVKLGEEYERN